MAIPGAATTALGRKHAHRGFFCKSSEPSCTFCSLKDSQVALLGLIMSSSHGLTTPTEESTPLISISSPDFQGKPRPHQHSDEYPRAPPLCPLCEDTPPPVAQPHCPADRVPWLQHSAGVLTAVGPGMGSGGPRTHIQPDTELSPGLEPALQSPGHSCCRGEGSLQSCRSGWLVCSLFLSLIYQMLYSQT